MGSGCGQAGQLAPQHVDLVLEPGQQYHVKGHSMEDCFAAEVGQRQNPVKVSISL